MDEQQQEFREHLIDQAELAIKHVRELVAQLNDREKSHLRNASPAYRQLVEGIRAHYADKKVPSVN